MAEKYQNDRFYTYDTDAPYSDRHNNYDFHNSNHFRDYSSKRWEDQFHQHFQRTQRADYKRDDDRLKDADFEFEFEHGLHDDGDFDDDDFHEYGNAFQDHL